MADTRKKTLQAEYVTCEKDIFGDIETITIKDISSGKHMTLTSDQISKACLDGLIEIKYIKVSFDGKVHITKKNRKTVAEKIKSLEKEITKLEKAAVTAEDKDNLVKKRRELEKLRDQKYKW